MFEFSVRNTRTKETTAFLGQGETMAQAWGDGIKNVGDAYRHKQDGRPHPPLRMAVTLPDGRTVNRTQKLFESDTPYAEAEEPER